MQCPACGAAMLAHHVLGVEVDACPACRGAWLDPGEAEVHGVDPAALFGIGPGAATFDRVSERKCPRHGRNMETYVAASDQRRFEVERADCCGGLFLDAGEGQDFAEAAAYAASVAGDAADQANVGAVYQGLVARAPEPVGVTGGAPAALAPQAASVRRCPRCRGPYETDRSLGAGAPEVDVCPGCGSMFLDAGEGEATGIDTAALFGVAGDAVVDIGPSSLGCPACGYAMRMVHVTTFAGVLEVDRATCCGGLFLDGGELDPLRRAAKRARAEEADRVFAEKGEYVGEAAMNRVMASGEVRAVFASMIRRRVDSMVHRMLHERARRDRHHHSDFDFD